MSHIFAGTVSGQFIDDSLQSFFCPGPLFIFILLLLKKKKSSIKWLWNWGKIQRWKLWFEPLENAKYQNERIGYAIEEKWWRLLTTRRLHNLSDHNSISDMKGDLWWWPCPFLIEGCWTQGECSFFVSC